MNDREIVESMDYAKVFNELKKDVRTSQLRAMRSVNKELIMLYHRIGIYILDLQKKQGWGSKVIDQLSKDLKSTFPEMKGFSVRNLKYMRKFAAEYPDIEKVQQVAAQLPWFHIVVILTSFDNHEIRDFYINKTYENGWSRNVLVMQIESKLHERQGKAVTNFKGKLSNELSDLAKNSLKDPYIFEFLNLYEKAKEKDIEQGLINHVRDFLLEMGEGFSFIGNQYHISVGGEDFYLDMLLYNIKLRSYVVVELKTGKFKPEYAGKLNFYLSAVDDLIRQPEDNPSIGLLLCKEKNNIVAEYALKDVEKPIGLASYKLGQAIPKNLQSSLPSVPDLEKGLTRIINIQANLSTENVDKLDEKDVKEKI